MTNEPSKAECDAIWNRLSGERAMTNDKATIYALIRAAYAAGRASVPREPTTDVWQAMHDAGTGEWK